MEAALGIHMEGHSWLSLSLSRWTLGIHYKEGLMTTRTASVSIGPLSVCVLGLQVPVHMILESRSHLMCHLAFGASHWPGTCIFSWGGWPLSPGSLMPRPLQHWHYKHMSLCPEFMRVLVIEVRSLNLQRKHWDIPHNPVMPFLSASCII